MQEVNYKILRKVIIFFLKLLPKINYKFNDLLVLLQLKNLDYSQDILSKLNDYLSCDDNQKEELKLSETPENIALYEKIISESEAIKLIPKILHDYIEANNLSNELTNILNEALSINELIESLFSIIKGTESALTNAHNLKQQMDKIDDIYLFLEYYHNRKKDEIDLVVENQIEAKQWNIFDLSWLESNIIAPLRKDNQSSEWIDTTDIETVFLSYLSLCDRNLVEGAEYWFRDKLREVETKLNEKIDTGDKDKPTRERSHSEKEALRLELDAEYFKENKKE